MRQPAVVAAQREVERSAAVEGPEAQRLAEGLEARQQVEVAEVQRQAVELAEAQRQAVEGQSAAAPAEEVLGSTPTRRTVSSPNAAASPPP